MILQSTAKGVESPSESELRSFDAVIVLNMTLDPVALVRHIVSELASRGLQSYISKGI